MLQSEDCRPVNVSPFPSNTRKPIRKLNSQACAAKIISKINKEIANVLVLGSLLGHLAREAEISTGTVQ